MAMLELDGRSVGYRDEGEGPLVLFAHCSLGQAGLWKGVTSRLAGRWRCVAFDLPGHGRTDRGDRSISLQDQAVADAAELARRFGDGRAHLVGLSLGGAIMARTSVRRPGLARSVTLIEPIMMQLIKDASESGMEENERVIGPVIAACREKRYADGARAFMEGWGQPGQFDRFAPEAQAAVSRAMRWVYEDFGMAHDWVDGQIGRDDLAALSLPAKVMFGETTHLSAKAVAAEVARLIPGATIEQVAGAGHLSPVDDPETVAARIDAFLSSVEAAAAA